MKKLPEILLLLLCCAATCYVGYKTGQATCQVEAAPARIDTVYIPIHKNFIPDYLK